MPLPLASPAEQWLSGDLAGPIVDGAHVAHLCVTTRSGPQITPQLFSLAGGRLWIVTPRNSMKARVVRVRPRVGVLLRSGQRGVLIRGDAEVLEPYGLDEVRRLVAQAPHALQAALEYAVRNGGTMVGYLGDLLRLPPPTGSIPYDRVLIAVDVRAALAWNGRSIAAELGDWDGAAAAPPQSPDGSGSRMVVREGLPAGIPGNIAEFTTRAHPVAVGWETGAGPVALPGRWDAGAWRAAVPAALVERLELPPRARGCIAFDRSSSYRPSKYTGLVLRGPGRLESRGRKAQVAVKTELVTWWTGFDVRTTKAAPGR